jgi:hypothetical protein
VVVVTMVTWQILITMPNNDHVSFSYCQDVHTVCCLLQAQYKNAVCEAELAKLKAKVCCFHNTWISVVLSLKYFVDFTPVVTYATVPLVILVTLSICQMN